MIDTSKTFSRLSIKKQILLGFTPVLILLISFAFISHYNFKAFYEDFQSFSNSTHKSFQIAQIEKDIVELQRNVLVYSYVGYTGVLRKISFLEKNLDTKFEEMRPALKGEPDLQERFTRMFEHYTGYKAGFEDSVKKRKELDTIKKNTLPDLEKQAEELLDVIIERFEHSDNYKSAYLGEEIEHGFLQARMNILQFQRTPDSILISKTSKIIDDISNDLKSIETQDTKTDIQELLKIYKAYQSSFKEYSTINRTYLQLVNVVLAGKASEIDALAREINQIILANSMNARTTMSTYLLETQNQYLFISILASVIGIMSAWYVAAGLARPVRDISSTLSELARGVTDSDIPGLSRKDELGQMAQAAQEFKTMATRIEQQRIRIEESETRLSAIVDNIVDGLVTIDEKGIIESANSACEHIFGYSQQELIGENVKFLMPEPYKSEHDGYLESHNKTGRKQIIGIGREVEGRHKSGRVFPLDLSVSEVYLDDRRIYTGIVRDITERQEAQEALKQANAELEEFAYRTSHDLRSPLVSSISLLDLAQDAIKDDEKDHALESLEHVQNSLTKLEVLVKDILSLTQAKNIEEEDQLIDFEALFNECVEKFKHMDNYELLTIETDFALDQDVYNKKTRAALIIENLFSNAIKYQDPSKDKQTIKISTSIESGYAVFKIQDNGLGIPKDQQDKMFIMFKRFHPKTSFGSGLGLYMMKKSAEILGGDISFEDPGNGCIFKLSIPIHGEYSA